MLNLKDKINEALKYLRERTSREVDIGIILGTGLGVLAQEVEDAVVIPYKDIPHFPQSAVPGHAGQLILGTLEGKSVAVFQGRVHYYEGYHMEEVTFSVRVMRVLGASVMLVTNAVGGMSKNLENGDLVAITDHINLMGMNPLRGRNDDQLGPRFPDMVHCYDPKLILVAQQAATEAGVTLKEGVFAAVSGPSFETRAEIRFLHQIGSDTVGMSTVPEVIVARHAGMRVLGVSCVTDVLYGDYQEVSHEQVLEVAKMAAPHFIKLMRSVIRLIVLQQGSHASR